MSNPPLIELSVTKIMTHRWFSYRLDVRHQEARERVSVPIFLVQGQLPLPAAFHQKRDRHILSILNVRNTAMIKIEYNLCEDIPSAQIDDENQPRECVLLACVPMEVLVSSRPPSSLLSFQFYKAFLGNECIQPKQTVPIGNRDKNSWVLLPWRSTR